MKQYKHKALFESIARCATDKDQDKHLALASTKAIKDLLPKNIDFNANYDLLPFAGNGAVINRANKNGHVIDSKTSIAINKNFVYKPMDLEHNRSTIVGVTLTSGYTTYGDSGAMTEEEALACVGPFNIAIGGVVFRIVNTDFAELLEQSSNPESLLYQAVSLSWEVLFDDYYIVLGSPNLEDAEIVKDENQIKELSKFTKMYGGEGKLEDGSFVGMQIYGDDVMGAAYGFTSRPAAAVKGVITANNNEDNKEKEKNIQNNKEIISHSTKTNVITISNYMKNINSLQEILALSTDDLKEVSAATMYEHIKSAIKNANESFVEKQNEASNAKATADELKSSVTDLTAKIDKMAASHAKEQAEASFNARMSLVDSEFDLTDADRKAVASQVSKFEDDASFESWYNDSFSIFAAAKKKKAPKDDPDNDDDDDSNDPDDKDDADDKKDSKAAKKSKADDDEALAAKKAKKDKDMKAAVASAVAEALQTALPKGFVLNLPVDGSKSFDEKYKGAFGKDGIELKK